uniref:Uncharacterized protein n=1 Tax=Oryza brachyantha TaxID=4533 RepID=J3KW39_ORYBR
MWRNPEYLTPNPSLSIDEDLFQPWSLWCIDRRAQTSTRRRGTAATTAQQTRSTTTTRSEKGLEDIYGAWCSRPLLLRRRRGGRRRRLRPPTRSLKPRPKAARGAKGLASSPPLIF